MTQFCNSLQMGRPVGLEFCLQFCLMLNDNVVQDGGALTLAETEKVILTSSIS